MQKHMLTLNRLHACEPSLVWAKDQSDFESIWNNCNRSDWMIWLLGNLKFSDMSIYRKYAVWCSRNTDMGNGKILWDYMTDERSRNCIEVAEKYISGNATIEELREARKNAYAYAYAYDTDAAYAAYATDAAYAADAAYAYAADAYAADAAAYATDAAYAYAADATADATRIVASTSQANYLRSIVPASIILELVERFNDSYQK